MKKFLLLCAFAVSAVCAGAETAGWSNANPDRKNLLDPFKILWRFTGTENDLTVEYKDGARGSVKLVKKDGADCLQITKSNSAGYMLIKAKKGLNAPDKTELQTYAYVHSQQSDPEYCIGALRLTGKNNDLSYFAGLNGRGGGGPKMLFINNTVDGVWERKLAHLLVTSKTGGDITPVIVVAGNPSVSYWKDWGVEDYAAAKKGWRKKYRSTKTPNAEPEFSTAELYRRLKKSPNHTGKVATVNGRSVLQIDGKTVSPVGFKNSAKAFSGKEYDRRGVNIRFLGIKFGPEKGGRNGVWSGRDKFDLESVIANLEEAMRIYPDSLFVVSIQMNHYRDFCKDYPDETWINKDGKVVYGHHVHASFKLEDKVPSRYWPWASIFSKVLYEATEKNVAALITEMNKRNLSKKVVGIHFAGYHDGQFSTRHTDYSKPAKAEFRNYLREKYKNDAGLRKAWGRNDVSLADVEPPQFTDEEFVMPGKEQDRLDWYIFLKNGSMRFQDKMAGRVRQLFGKDIFVVRYCQGPLGGAYVGSYDIDTFFACKNIDVLCGQPSYTLRLPGLACHTRLPMEAFHQNGKFFINEFDFRTWAKIAGETELRCTGLSNALDPVMWETINRKMAGMMIADGMGYWYLDMAGGWYEPPEIVDSIASIRKEYERLQKVPVNRFSPSAAVVYDLEGMKLRNLGGIYYSHENRIHGSLQLPKLALSGVPYDMVSLQDLMSKPELKKRYSTLVFCGMYHIDQPRKAFFAKLKGKTLILLSETGIMGGLKETFGMELELKNTKDTATKAAPGEPESHLSGEYIDLLSQNAGKNKRKLPARVSIRQDKAVKAAAFYIADNAVAIAERKFRGNKVVYIGSRGGLMPEYFNRLVKLSGGYVTSAPGMQVNMNGNFMSLHCIMPGAYKIALPFDSEVINLKDGKTMTVKERSFTVNAAPGSTYWFELKKKAVNAK